MRKIASRFDQDDRLRSAFAEAELSAFAVMSKVRLIAVVLITSFLLIEFPSKIGLFFIGYAVAVGIAGWLHFRIRRRYPGRSSWTYFFLTLDALIVTAAILVPNPFIADQWPIQNTLRVHSFPFHFVFLALAAMTYSPRYVMWMGGASATTWALAVGYIVALPETKIFLDYGDKTGPSGANKLALSLDPHFVHIVQPIQDVFIILVVAAILTAAVGRSKRLVRRQVTTERERTNLARYFSPNMIEELSAMDDPLGKVRTQQAAVLFADIVDFTSMSENQSPEETIAMLRTFHGLMADQIFTNNGTVDKYIGDAVMATFGTPRTGPTDAGNAIDCARGMLGAVANWNQARVAGDSPPIRVSIGVHYGPVVLGDIGNEQRLEFAVIGDTVNVASRLEHLTREHRVPVLISEQTMAAARLETEGDDSALADLTRSKSQRVRGREQVTETWTLAPA